MKNKLKYLFVITFVIIMGLLINKLINYPNKDFHIDKTKPQGLGLFISNNNDTLHHLKIDISKISDYQYIFTNNTGKDLNFSITMFINGEQIKLIDPTSNTYENHINLNIENQKSKSIPLMPYLENLSEGSYIANLVLIDDYQKNAINHNEKTWINSTYKYNFILSNKTDKLIFPKENYIEANKEFIEEYSDLSQFLINVSKDSLNKNLITSSTIDASPGTLIDIPIILGGGEMNSALLYATLNSTQISINSNNYIKYNLNKNNFIYDNITIKAPDKPGKYELLFYSTSSSPQLDINKPDTISTSIKTNISNRVTLTIK